MEQLVIAMCVTTKQCYVHFKTGGQCAGVCHVMLATQHIGHLVANMQVGNKLAYHTGSYNIIRRHMTSYNIIRRHTTSYNSIQLHTTSY